MVLSDVTNFLGITTPPKNKPPTYANPPAEAHDVEPIEKEVFYKWEISERPKFFIDRKAVKTVLVILGVVSLVLIAMQEYFLVLLLASIVFLCYVLSVTAPEKVEHEVSNKGLSFAGHFYGWQRLKSFFFIEKEKSLVLGVDTYEAFPGRLFFMLQSGDKQKLQDYLGKYIAFLEAPPRTVLDKMYDSVADQISLNNK